MKLVKKIILNVLCAIYVTFAFLFVLSLGTILSICEELCTFTQNICSSFLLNFVRLGNEVIDMFTKINKD